MGHFAEFAILGALLSSTIFAAISPISKAEAKKLLPLFYALPGTFVVGCIDELLQNLSEGRHPAFTDVLIDTSGGLFGIAAVLTALLFIRHIKAKRKTDST